MIEDVRLTGRGEGSKIHAHVTLFHTISGDRINKSGSNRGVSPRERAFIPEISRRRKKKIPRWMERRRRRGGRIRYPKGRVSTERERERNVNYPCSSHIPFYVSRAINSEGESAKGEEAGEEQFLHGLPRGSSLALRG